MTRDFQAERVDLSFATDPSGLALTLEGNPVAPPLTVTSWAGYGVAVDAPSPDRRGRQQLRLAVLVRRRRRVAYRGRTPEAPAAYTATFTAEPGSPLLLHPRALPAE